MSLKQSLITPQHRPILGQAPTGSGFQQGQPKMMIYMPDFRVKSAAKRLRQVMRELGVDALPQPDGAILGRIN
jgi:hypothetical protein